MNKSFRSIYINGEKRKIFPVILYIIFAFMGSAGAVFSFTDCFDFGKDASFYLIWMILALGISITFLIDSLRDKVFCIFLLGTMGFIFLQYKVVLASFIRVCNILIKGINESYQMGLERITMPQELPYYTGVETALVLVVIIVTFLTAYFVLGRSSVAGCICTTLPLTIFGIFFDIFPRLEFLLLSVTFWIVAVVLFASGKRGKRTANGAVYNGLYAAVVIWILYLAGQIIMPQKNYVRAAFLEDAKRFVEENMSVLTEHYELGFLRDGNQTGIGRGEFGSYDDIHFNGDSILEVSLPASSRNVYLRTAEYNSYVGNKWENNDAYFHNYFNGSFDDMGSSGQPQNITASILKNLENELYLYEADTQTYDELVTDYQVTVRDFTDAGVPFAPYGAVFETGRMETDVMPVKKGTAVYEYDVYTTANIQEFCELFPTETFLSYWNMISAQMPTMHDAVFYQIASNEKEYAAFVRKAYTQVPDNLSSMLRRYAPETIEYSCVPEIAFANEIRQMFTDNFQYTLAPGKVPEGMDGVDYFLNENRQGYCVYFASAATLIFRQAGIPARYVEGFVITPDMMQGKATDGKVTVTVRDDKAHAWTEIYIAGYGWIPIEVTPGYYTENVYAEQEEITQEEQEETSEAMEEETTAKKQEESTAGMNNSGSASSAVSGGQAVKALIILTGILLVIFGLFFVYELLGRKRKEKTGALFYGKEGIDNNERAFLAWWYIEELLFFKKTPLPENMTVFQQKQFIKERLEFFSNDVWNGKIDSIIEVYFGNRLLTDEETDGILEMVRHLRKWFYDNLKGTDKVKFQYIYKL